MKELNIFQRFINQFSQEWCDYTGERMSVPHGINGEGQRTCEPCEYTEECPVRIMREKIDYELGQEYSEKL